LTTLPPNASFSELLDAALQRDQEALGALLARYDPYLYLLAQRRLGRQLQARLDPADLVQQTLLEAQRDLATFRGRDEAAFLAWLTVILQHNVSHMIQRHLVAKKRSALHEYSLDEPRETGPAYGETLAADQSSPSQRAMRGEAAVRLAQAIRSLPPDQQEAIRLRHLEGCTLREIADSLQRSELAAAGLIKRGLQRLRVYFEKDLDASRREKPTK
jgi:RNA polymerase sigma-70 factor, ECF subfamily